MSELDLGGTKGMSSYLSRIREERWQLEIHLFFESASSFLRAKASLCSTDSFVICRKRKIPRMKHQTLLQRNESRESVQWVVSLWHTGVT